MGDAPSASLELEIGELFIDATSAIDVTGKGYLGGYWEGNGCEGRTLGNVEGAGRRGGGSYGGVGGADSNAV